MRRVLIHIRSQIALARVGSGVPGVKTEFETLNIHLSVYVDHVKLVEARNPIWRRLHSGYTDEKRVARTDFDRINEREVVGFFKRIDSKATAFIVLEREISCQPDLSAQFLRNTILKERNGVRAESVGFFNQRCVFRVPQPEPQCPC